MLQSLAVITPSAVVVVIVSVLILLTWDKIPFLKNLKAIPAALAVVAVVILLNQVFMNSMPDLAITEKHLVGLPLISSFSDIPNLIALPDFNGFFNQDVWTLGRIQN